MTSHDQLVSHSITLLLSRQEPSGAFLACPSFPTYRYSWYRDGTFIAHALDLWGKHEAARRFYDWGADVVLRHAHTVNLALSSPAHRPPRSYLHTRYNPDGTPGQDDWPNFQLDGFGTFLWGLAEHVDMTGVKGVPDAWLRAAELLTAYLHHLWRAPNYDCWEEFHDKIHISTLAAIYAGLRDVSCLVDIPHATETAEMIRRFILDQETIGILPKYVGSVEVDASTLWACSPFDVLNANDPIASRTIERVEQELVGRNGGVHRYAEDSYYGGGAWILLTASLAECLLAQGRVERATELCRWIEQQADAAGNLPEQIPVDLNRPEMYETWVGRWGDIASPLLWSHASYLRLRHLLHIAEQPDEVAS
jgi:GH15 family glucan-1,4-alpha-glucosidase